VPAARRGTIRQMPFLNRANRRYNANFRGFLISLSRNSDFLHFVNKCLSEDIMVRIKNKGK
jgi:hypothetical protein